MGNLLIRRREMILHPAETGCPYITDGLIFWLDGINRGGVAGEWKDLIGGKVFTLMNCSEDVKGVVFNGSTSYGVYDGAVSRDFSSETIEAAVANWTKDTDFTILYPPYIDGSVGIAALTPSAAFPKNMHYRTDGVNSTQYQNVKRSWSSLSMKSVKSSSDQGCIADGEAATASGADSWGKNTSGKTYIGARAYLSTPKKFLGGELRSIRIYNRRLTEAEMLFNQAADTARFGQ